MREGAARRHCRVAKAAADHVMRNNRRVVFAAGQVGKPSSHPAMAEGEPSIRGMPLPARRRCIAIPTPHSGETGLSARKNGASSG